MDVVFARLWDLGEDSCDKLEDVECFSMGMGVEWVFVRAVGLVEQGFGAGIQWMRERLTGQRSR